MEERFLVSGSAPKAERAVPLIALPVPKEARDKQGRWKALPGAPMTYLDDQPAVHLDLEQFVADCEKFGNFTASRIEEISEYFKNEGREVQSFASYKVGPNAVLNIDCSEPYLLGDELEFISTFSSLLLPVQLLLAELLLFVYDSTPATQSGGDDERNSKEATTGNRAIEGIPGETREPR